MDLTEEEIAAVMTLRASKKAEEEKVELARRQQAISASIATLIAEAKTCLQDAKRIADDNGMSYNMQSMVTDMLSEVDSNIQWYGSDASLC